MTRETLTKRKSVLELNCLFVNIKQITFVYMIQLAAYLCILNRGEKTKLEWQNQHSLNINPI